MTPFQIVAHLQSLLFSEDKPAELRPVDIALLSYLLLRQTYDHYIYDSQLTLAQRLGCERKGVAESIKKLSDMGWIVRKASWEWNEKTKRKTRSIGRTVGLSINLDKLPQAKDRGKPSLPSPDAIKIATGYTAMLKAMGVRLHKGFGKQQEHAAQRLIEELNGFQPTTALIQFAIDDPQFQKTAYKSLYEIRTRLPAIKRAYDAAQCAR